MQFQIDNVVLGRRRDSSLGDLTVRGNADGSAFTVDGQPWWPTVFLSTVFDGQTSFASLEAFPAGAVVEVSAYIETAQTLSEGDLAIISGGGTEPVIFNFYTNESSYDSPAYCCAVVTLVSDGFISVDVFASNFGVIVRMRRLA